MNQYEPKPGTHLCFKCRNKFSTNKEQDFNKMRALVLTKDHIEGKYTITINEDVYRSLQELSQGMKVSNTPFSDIIKLCIESYIRDQENNGNDPLTTIVTNEEAEE